MLIQLRYEEGMGKVAGDDRYETAHWDQKRGGYFFGSISLIRE